MFLVRRASEVMDPDVLVLPREASFDDFLRQPEHDGRLRHVVVTQQGPALRRDPGQYRASGAASETRHTGVTLGDVASRNFIVVGEDAVVFDVIERMWRKDAVMAIVAKGRGVPHGGGRDRRDHQGACRRLRRQQRANLPAGLSGVRGGYLLQPPQRPRQERLLPLHLLEVLASEFIEERLAGGREGQQHAATILVRRGSFEPARPWPAD